MGGISCGSSFITCLHKITNPMSGEIQIFGFLARIIVEETGFGYNLFNLAAIRPIVIAGNIDETNMIKYSCSPGNAIVLCYYNNKIESKYFTFGKKLQKFQSMCSRTRKLWMQLFNKIHSLIVFKNLFLIYLCCESTFQNPLNFF